jgi:regulator of sigma E protease
MITLFYFLITIGIIVFIHELGHFLAAKAVGIRVERFSIGYPPRIYGRQYGDTDYCISAIPLGGYVKMSGMIDESLGGEEKLTGAPHEFMSKKTWEKTLVITAGVLMNFVLAFVIFSFLAGVQGIPTAALPVVNEVVAGSPAEQAGLRPADRIVSIDGTPVETWEQLVGIIQKNPDRSLAVRWTRAGAEMQATVVPRSEESKVDGQVKQVGKIGIAMGPYYKFEPVGPGGALKAGWEMTIGGGALVVKSLWRAVTSFSMKELGGPIAIANASREAAKAGALYLLNLIGMLSLSIGLLNLLPIPALDGGHLVIVLVEGISRRKLGDKVKIAIQQVGMVLLLLLMAGVIVKDIIHFGVWDKIRGLF